MPSKRPKRGVDHTCVHGKSIINDDATKEPDKASKGAARTRLSNIPDHPAVVQQRDRGASQTVHREGSQDNSQGRSMSIVEPSGADEPLRRRVRIADRARQQGHQSLVSSKGRVKTGDT